MDFGEEIFWSGTRRLRWNEIGVGDGSYHAALVAAETLPGLRIVAHRHDFFEMMFVLEGGGYHYFASPREASQNERLTAGDLVFLRPDDCHSLAAPPGGRLHWINIAFPASAWETFRIAADLSPSEWDVAARPPSVHLVNRESQATCTTLFQSVLQRFQAGRASQGAPAPDRLELCAFLASAVLLLHRNESREGRPGIGDEPPWLTRACRALQREIDREEGGEISAARLAVLAGVSPGHLARTFKSVMNVTPTEWVNRICLMRAALLLTTTTRPIVDIAGSCGFGQLSYFYRLFRRRFGIPPDAYRRAALGPLMM